MLHPLTKLRFWLFRYWYTYPCWQEVAYILSRGIASNPRAAAVFSYYVKAYGHINHTAWTRGYSRQRVIFMLRQLALDEQLGRFDEIRARGAGFTGK